MDVIPRRQIQPSLGASGDNFSPQALQDIPQGDNVPLNQVLLQAPSVAQDGFGQIHLRGEHANVQYGLSSVQQPEGISVFGQAIESRFANSLSLITGAQLNESQRKGNDFAVISLQKHINSIDVQASVFMRCNSLRFSPEPVGDLLFDGIARAALRWRLRLANRRELAHRRPARAALRRLLQQDVAGSKTFSQVLLTDATGTLTTDTPVGIPNSFTKTGSLYGVYVQDEWRILPRLTVNGGP